MNVEKMKEEMKNELTLHDCKELKKLILENPEAPLVATVTEFSWGEEYPVEIVDRMNPIIQEMTKYKGCFYDKDMLYECLQEEMEDDENYKHMTNDQFFKAIDERIEEMPFIDVICISC